MDERRTMATRTSVHHSSIRPFDLQLNNLPPIRRQLLDAVLRHDEAILVAQAVLAVVQPDVHIEQHPRLDDQIAARPEPEPLHFGRPGAVGRAVEGELLEAVFRQGLVVVVEHDLSGHARADVPQRAVDPFQRYAHQVAGAVGHPADGERPAHVAAIPHVPRAEGELHQLVALDAPVGGAAQALMGVRPGADPDRVGRPLRAEPAHGHVCARLDLPLGHPFRHRIERLDHRLFGDPVRLADRGDLVRRLDALGAEQHLVGRHDFCPGRGMLQVGEDRVREDVPVGHADPLRQSAADRLQDRGEILVGHRRHPVGRGALDEQRMDVDVLDARELPGELVRLRPAGDQRRRDLRAARSRLRNRRRARNRPGSGCWLPPTRTSR